MTSEVVIMNNLAAAVAADSAVTISPEGDQGERKTFASANKIFPLASSQPIGIMVYGSADLMGVPWETVVSIYAAKLARKRFDFLHNYSDDFLSFVEGHADLMFPPAAQRRFFELTVGSYFSKIREDVQAAVEQLIAERGSVTDDDVKRQVARVVRAHRQAWDAAEPLAGPLESCLRDFGPGYEEAVTRLTKAVFDRLPIQARVAKQLSDIALSLFTRSRRDVAKPGSSGVVFVGFGERDVFPSLQLFIVHCVANGRLRYIKDRETGIGLDVRAVVAPFGQSEMVATFMEGVDPAYQAAIERGLERMLVDYPRVVLEEVAGLSQTEKDKIISRLNSVAAKVLKQYRDGLKHYRQTRHVTPVTSVVAHLPKDELASMAESLVRLTSLKRKVSPEAETVAEPIDVAVISKADGFVWVKRKCYFDTAYNRGDISVHGWEDERGSEKKGE